MAVRNHRGVSQYGGDPTSSMTAERTRASVEFNRCQSDGDLKNIFYKKSFDEELCVSLSQKHSPRRFIPNGLTRGVRIPRCRGCSATVEAVAWQPDHGAEHVLGTKVGRCLECNMRPGNKLTLLKTACLFSCPMNWYGVC